MSYICIHFRYTPDTVDDDEIQLLLSTDNDTSSVSIDECEQATTGLTIPKLPNSLEYHLYVVSASEDRLVVNELVTKLESKYAIKCMFSDRDFQPGKEILQNVKDGMEKSMKILLIYTPNFGRSEFCKLETNIALQSAMDSGIYCIIPVMLQECEVTFSMRHKTYINGTLPGMTISKIADYIKEAMTRTGNFFNYCWILCLIGILGNERDDLQTKATLALDQAHFKILFSQF